MNLSHAIVVLNDGETFTGLTGSKILILTDEGLEKLDDNTPDTLNPEDIELAIDIEDLLLQHDNSESA